MTEFVSKSIICGCRDAYILGKKTITVAGQGEDAAARAADKKNNK